MSTYTVRSKGLVELELEHVKKHRKRLEPILSSAALKGLDVTPDIDRLLVKKNGRKAKSRINGKAQSE